MPLIVIDCQLIDRCLRHDAGAWHDFVDRYMGLIYHIIHHVSYSRSLGLSDADIDGIRRRGLPGDRRGRLRRLTPVQGHQLAFDVPEVVARRICLREVVRRLREAELWRVAAQHRGPALQDEATAPAETEPVASAEEVEQMLKGLPEREAEVVCLYHLKSLNYRQISRQLGIPENSVSPILSKARKHLLAWLSSATWADCDRELGCAG